MAMGCAVARSLLKFTKTNKKKKKNEFHIQKVYAMRRLLCNVDKSFSVVTQCAVQLRAARLHYSTGTVCTIIFCR